MVMTNSERGRASRQKGKRGELELAHKLTDMGFDCRRAQQYCGGASSADILGLDGVHPECKFVERLNVVEAYEQAVRDGAGTTDMPVVFHKRSRKPFLVTMGLEDWCKLYRAYLEGLDNEKKNPQADC